MKKYLPITLFLVLFIAVAGWTANATPAPDTAIQTSSAVQVPDALKIIVSALLLGAVTLGFQALFNTFGLDLRGVSAAVAVAISGFIVAQVQGYINVIPPNYDTMVMIVLNVLTVVLGGIGTIRSLIHPQYASNMFQA